MHKSLIDILQPELKPNSELKPIVTTSAQVLPNPMLAAVRCIDIEISIFRMYDVRRHIIVPNVSDQMCLVPFETDMLVLSQSNYATGYEIKVSKSDLLADLKKKQYLRFKDKENGSILQELYYAKKFKYFYYAVPQKLKEIALQIIPEFVGLYVYDNNGIGVLIKVKDAKKLKTQNWSEKDKVELMRLGTMRIYSLKLGLSYRS
jgi:hypothetical protein